jgi:Phospholipase_D-nuclease N-terminal
MPGIDIIPIAITIFWIWMLIDCITNNKIRGGSKVCWLLAIFFTHIVGAVIYYFMRSSQKNPVTAFTYYYEVISKFFKQSAPQRSQPMPPPQSYADYQHGYQEQRYEPSAQEQPLYTPPRVEYEEPLTITYPEMPQQHQ